MWSGRLIVATALALLLAPAAVAGPRKVPDEAALIEYVDALPSAEGPVLADGSGPNQAPAQAPAQLTATADQRLSVLPAGRAAALRRLTRPPGAANAAGQSGQPGPLRASQPSTAGALGSALGSAKAPSLVLALLLAGALMAAAAERYWRHSRSPSE